VPVEVFLDDGLEFAQQVQVCQVFVHSACVLLGCRGSAIWLCGTPAVICTCWLQSIYLCNPVTSSWRGDAAAAERSQFSAVFRVT